MSIFLLGLFMGCIVTLIIYQDRSNDDPPPFKGMAVIFPLCFVLAYFMFKTFAGD